MLLDGDKKVDRYWLSSDYAGFLCVSESGVEEDIIRVAEERCQWEYDPRKEG